MGIHTVAVSCLAGVDRSKEVKEYQGISAVNDATGLSAHPFSKYIC